MNLREAWWQGCRFPPPDYKVYGKKMQRVKKFIKFTETISHCTPSFPKATKRLKVDSQFLVVSIRIRALSASQTGTIKIRLGNTAKPFLDYIFGWIMSLTDTIC